MNWTKAGEGASWRADVGAGISGEYGGLGREGDVEDGGGENHR